MEWNDMQMHVYLSVGNFGSIRWNFRKLPPRFLRRSSGFVDDVDCKLGNGSMALFFLLFMNDSGIWHWTNWQRKMERKKNQYPVMFDFYNWMWNLWFRWKWSAKLTSNTEMRGVIISSGKRHGFVFFDCAVFHFL